MSYLGNCKRCGKEKWLMDKTNMCVKCSQEVEQEKIKREFDEFNEQAEPDEEFDTWSSDFVICPHCGYAIPADVSYEDFPEIYEEGGHELTCPECNKDFILETSVSYSYETRKGWKN